MEHQRWINDITDSMGSTTQVHPTRNIKINDPNKYLPALRTGGSDKSNPHKLVVDSVMMESIHHDSHAFYPKLKIALRDTAKKQKKVEV